MSASSPATVAAVAQTDAQARLDALLDKVMPFANVADALARRTVGRVRTLALLGLFAAIWLAYACGGAFDWGLGGTLTLFLPLVIPAAVLWRIHGMLRSVIGAPQRIASAAARAYGKAVEYRELYERREQRDVGAKVGFRELWRTATSVLEVKTLTDEGQELVALIGGALVLANPLFGIVLAAGSILTLLLVLVAALVGVAYLI